MESVATVEGLAARFAAERGAPAVVLSEARACLAQIDSVLNQPALDDEAFLRYVTLNQQFHNLLSEMAAGAVISRELDRVVMLPFASPSAFVIVQANSP